MASPSPQKGSLANLVGQLWLIGWALPGPLPAPAIHTVQATVTRVGDGNTVRVEDAHGTKLRIRLLGIDAPEVGHLRKQRGATPGQPWGDEARRVLADRVLRPPVTLEVFGHDRHRRILGVIFQGRTNINLWVVQSGMAWAYRGGRNDAPADLRRQLEGAEQDSRQANRGRLADPDPEVPRGLRQQVRLGRREGGKP